MESTQFYSLAKIATWQLSPTNESVALPELQRGFVWKNTQIEILWDSLLRGYPISSFLLARDAEEKLFLLDGQQRATSIALGFYNPWENENKTFWSLKKAPVLWIDLAAKERPETQKYSLRLVTQSHPWGYQNTANDTILSISDRRDAWKIFKKNPANLDKGYTAYSSENVFPYDSYLPVPLPFLISAAQSDNWQKTLIEICEENLPGKGEYIEPKYCRGKYLDQLEKKITSSNFDSSIIEAIRNLNEIKIPCIITRREILESEDEQAGEEPTLFIRLNTQGTQLSNEELIYSMYKAAFPKAKELVERIGAGFIAPSVVISLFSRLALSEINHDEYPSPINVYDFRKQIKKRAFTKKLNELIGSEISSPAKDLFKKALEILQMKDDIDIPPVLVKELLKHSRELLLMVLQWLRVHQLSELSSDEKRKIFAAFTALSWFGRDNTRYVRELWDDLKSDTVWSKRALRKPYYHNNEHIMYPLIQPSVLRDFLIEQVVNRKITLGELYIKDGDPINEQYKHILDQNFKEDGEQQGLINDINDINDIWRHFIGKLVYNRSLVLFAQRKYINKEFADFNQLEDLEDTNTPWDWDHIYPQSWVYKKKSVPDNVRHWTGTIGNLRALALLDNRRKGDREAPSEIPDDVKEGSFIKEKDGKFWSKVENRVDGENPKEIKNYVSAVIHRFCNIYEEWYEICKVGELF